MECLYTLEKEDVQTLNDDIKYLFGKDANAVHRIDKETSGLVLVSKNKESEVDLKTLFENKLVEKEYIALVNKEIDTSLEINKKILTSKPDSLVRLKVHIDESGKTAHTKIKPLKYFDVLDKTLVKATPLTGRQHQIRVHLFHVEHSIVGDPIYGVEEEFAASFLEGRVQDEQREKKVGARRLLLHASRIRFEYKNDMYDISSKVDIEKEFLKELR